MSAHVTLNVRRLERSNEVASEARALIQQLEREHDRVIRCELTVDAPAGIPAPAGRPPRYRATLCVTVPGAQILGDSSHGPGDHGGDALAALRAAFRDAGRQLNELRAQRATHLAIRRS